MDREARARSPMTARSHTIDDGQLRVGAWLLLVACLYLIAGLVAVLGTATVNSAVLAPLGFDAEAGTAGWGLYLAAQPPAWGLGAAALAVPFARRLVPESRFGASPWWLLGTGVALASLTTFLLHEFVRARFGWFDVEYVGLAGLSVPAIVAIALAGWAARALPRSVRGPAVVLVVLGLAGLVLVLVPSLGGLRDGIRPASLPLAGTLLLDVGFGAFSVAMTAPVSRRAAKRTTGG